MNREWNLPEDWYAELNKEHSDVDMLDVGIIECDDSSDEDFVFTSTDPEKFDQKELSDLIRDCGLTKEKAELLASRLKEKNLLKQGTTATFYRNRETKICSTIRRKRFIRFLQRH